MEENIYKAFSEVSDILKHSEMEIQRKIPEKLRKMLEKNKDRKYVVKIDYSKNINEQKLLNETRQIISLIYRDYLCIKEEREELINKNNSKLEEQYSIERVFETKKNRYKVEEKSLIVHEEKKWYKKILEKIFKILKNK